MSQPTTYVRAFNFTNQQSVTPSAPLPADQVDQEYNRIKVSLDETQANLALIQRDDGALRNASIGYDQLKAELNGFGFNPPEPWATATNYLARDTVFADAGFYQCVTSHISDVFADDLADGKWLLIADFTAATTAAAASAAAALASQNAAAASEVDAEAAAASTDADVIATAADRVQTGLDKTATAADRVQTGQDKTATAADRVQTGLDAVATAADRVQTGQDRVAVAAAVDGLLIGLEYGNSVADANNDITYGAGSARDLSNTATIPLLAGMTKRLDANWSAGTNNGGLDTGTKAANTWYAIFLIANAIGGSADLLFSTSFTNPAMPTGYSLKRRVGVCLTDGSGNILPFLKASDWFFFKTPISNVSIVNNAGSISYLRTVSAPPGQKWEMDLGIALSGGTGGPGFDAVSDPDRGTPGNTYFVSYRSAGAVFGVRHRVHTNVNAQVVSWSEVGGAPEISIWTHGFIDKRGKA